MSIAEKYKNEGWVEGKAEGVLAMFNLIKKAFSPDEALQKIRAEQSFSMDFESPSEPLSGNESNN